MRLLFIGILLSNVHASWALWTDCALGNVLDLGAKSQELLEIFWDEHVRNYSHIHIDSGTSLDEGRFFMRWALLFTQSEDVLTQVVSDCLFGVLTVLLQAVPAIEYENGRADALGILSTARSILVQASQLEDFQIIMNEARSLGWDVDAISRTINVYKDVMVSKRRDTNTNDCTGARFYVYPQPALESRDEDATVKSLLHGDSSDYLYALSQRPLQCLFGMYGTENLFHRYFDTSPCRVFAPEEADLFYVPSYFKCIEVLNYVEHFNKDDNEADTLFQQTVDYIRQTGQWFQRYNGADHVFLFSWGRFPCRLRSWRTGIASGIALQVENYCEDLNFEEPQPTFNRWKDIIIPGHIDHWRVVELQRHNHPIESRDVFISFHGRYSENADSYENVTVRNRIVAEMQGLPGVSVGGFIEGYHELLGKSIFCLAPRGITPWTIHLFVAMLSGCIPVILSDSVELPFVDIVDWKSFSIKWPEDKVGKELHVYLQSLPSTVIRQMKQRVDENSCWFNYYSGVSGCSPYAAVVQKLDERFLQRPASLPISWNPTD